MGAFGGVPLDMDPVSGERWDDGLEAEAVSAAERIAHLEEMLVRNDQVMADQAQLIADQKAERDQLRDQLERANRRFEVARRAGAQALEEVVELRQQAREQATRAGRLDEQLGQAQARITALEDSVDIMETEVAELRAALKRAQDRAVTASEAAEEYRRDLLKANRLLEDIGAALAAHSGN